MSSLPSPSVYLGDLSKSHEVENVRRSIAMLAPRAPALNREEACAVLEALIAALLDAKRTPAADPNAES